jgi:hypothetical protein
MILGKLKEKQEISQERSVTMVPEPRNANRSGCFPAQLRTITERKPTSLCFPIYDKLPSFSPTQLSNQVSVEIPRLNPGLNIHTSSSPSVPIQISIQVPFQVLRRGLLLHSLNRIITLSIVFCGGSVSSLPSSSFVSSSSLLKQDYHS